MADSYMDIAGWHGMGEISEAERESVATSIIEGCARTTVLGSASVQDARDRNCILSSMGIAPFSEAQMTQIDFKAGGLSGE
jgi:hypothetical protein